METARLSKEMTSAGPTRVTVIRPSDRSRETAQTPGMTREQAVATGNQWAGHVKTAASMTSGWHHHGDYDTTIYVLTGAIRIESGANGQEVVEGRPGDFVFVPRQTVHRESNPTGQPSEVIVVRVGSGLPVVNVKGPGMSH